MKNILVLGASGMAGHTIYEYLRFHSGFNVYSTARNDKYIVPDYYINISEDLKALETLIKNKKIDIVINCIGLLVKSCEDDIKKAIYVNSYFPHYLEYITKNTNTKIIHLSTDCVFTGKKGNYSELDSPDEISNYGRSKILGELNNSKDLTLRTSIIGDELKSDGSGLFEWFMRQEGTVKGYNQCFWNGITTLELAKQIKKIIELPTNLFGLYHLVPNVYTNKYTLLLIMAEVFNKKIFIKATYKPEKNKVLINNRTITYDPKIPSYDQQLIELKEFIK